MMMVLSKKLLPQLRAFILSGTKRTMNNFIRRIDGFQTNKFYYTDTASPYFDKKHRDDLDRVELVGGNLCQSKSDNNSGGFLLVCFSELKSNTV